MYDLALLALSAQREPLHKSPWQGLMLEGVLCRQARQAGKINLDAHYNEVMCSAATPGPLRV